MFVMSPRGRGVAQALLARIEKEATRRGICPAQARDGNASDRSASFLQRAGFQPCAAFGAYATMTPEAVATGVFPQKQLGE